MRKRKQQPVNKRQVSMEEFGPIAVDWFTGHRVTSVLVTKPKEHKDGDPVWSIEFDNGGFIHSYDPTIEAPKAIVGAALTRTMLSQDGTTMHFGLEAVTLNPLEYSIEHPTYTRGLIVFAQRSDYNMPVIAPHDDDRTATGPEDDGV